MFKKCRVVMLPSVDKTNSIIFLFDEKLYFRLIHNSSIAQHLYILSNDEINKGDYVINGMNNLVYIHCYNNDLKCYQYIINGALCEVKSDDKKIIASTDSSLEIHTSEKDELVPFKEKMILLHGGERYSSIPSISQSFIEKYVGEYDEGNQIKEVMVEYEAIPNKFDNPMSNPEGKDNFDGAEWELKLNSDNTINIQSVKDSWTREEVIELMSKSFINGVYDKMPEQDWMETNL